MFHTHDVRRTAKTTVLTLAFAVAAALVAPSSALALEFTEGFEEFTTAIGDTFQSGPFGRIRMVRHRYVSS